MGEHNFMRVYPKLFKGSLKKFPNYANEDESIILVLPPHFHSWQPQFSQFDKNLYDAANCCLSGTIKLTKMGHPVSFIAYTAWSDDENFDAKLMF